MRQKRSLRRRAGGCFFVRRPARTCSLTAGAPAPTLPCAARSSTPRPQASRAAAIESLSFGLTEDFTAKVFTAKAFTAKAFTAKAFTVKAFTTKAFTVSASPPSPVDTTASPRARLRTLPSASVTLGEGFWSQRRTTNREVSLRHGTRMLEKSGAFQNFRLAAAGHGGRYRNPQWRDQDVYKWLEAVAYEVGGDTGGELKRHANEAIEAIVAAQAEDGYLHTYHQVVEPDQRWADLGRNHELYCAGHLIEAALAFHRVAADERLLEVARRLADHIGSVFGPGRRAGGPGHPQIELALVELYRATRERSYLDLARYFLDQRGRGAVGKGWYNDPAYHQDHVPVREAEAVEGHAVRALYLTTGMTDVYLETGEQALFDAVMRQWHDMTAGKLFVTGGVGARHEQEAFGEPYELPSDRCYCETCAAIASIMWNWRLLLATADGRYADLIERTLYNAFLSGVSLDGRTYFYGNPLMSRGGIERKEWFDCACCPPNVTRVLAYLPHYFATGDAAGVQIHLYDSAVIHAELAPGRSVRVRTDTGYPWQATVKLTIEDTDGSSWRLQLRVPAWCARPALRVNARALPDVEQNNGYATLERRWQVGDTVELELPMAPRLVEAHPRSDSTRGSVAIERGPIVYCLEAPDQDPSVNIMDMQINETAPLEDAWRRDLLGGVTTVKAGGYALDVSSWENELYKPLGSGRNCPRRRLELAAIPYYAWANRGPHAMRVWIPRGGS